MKTCARSEPDIVVLDVGLPDADGFSVAQAVRALLPRIGIIMLTGHGETSEQVRGLSQGADAYLVKPAQIDLLAATVHSLARRLRGATPPAPAARTRRSGISTPTIGASSRRPDATIPLTKTEQRVLARLSSTLGQLVTREHLVAAVADDVHDFDPHRIESLIHRLRRKVLARCGEPLPLKAIHGKGYVLEDTRHTRGLGRAPAPARAHGTCCPRPGALSTSIVPPEARIMSWITDSPRPVPPVSDFMLKNGSKTR